MKNLIRKLLRKQWFLYLLVGGSNTAICWVLSFLLPHFLHTGYWATSLVTLVFGAAYTYFLNRRFTFDAADVPHKKTLPRFVVNVAVCYLLAYGIVKPLMRGAQPDVSVISADLWTTISLLCANVVYIAFNFIGQKFFAFSKKQKTE